MESAGLIAGCNVSAMSDNPPPCPHIIPAATLPGSIAGPEAQPDKRWNKIQNKIPFKLLKQPELVEQDQSLASVECQTKAGEIQIPCRVHTDVPLVEGYAFHLLEFFTCPSQRRRLHNSRITVSHLLLMFRFKAPNGRSHWDVTYYVDWAASISG